MPRHNSERSRFPSFSCCWYMLLCFFTRFLNTLFSSTSVSVDCAKKATRWTSTMPSRQQIGRKMYITRATFDGRMLPLRTAQTVKAPSHTPEKKDGKDARHMWNLTMSSSRASQLVFNIGAVTPPRLQWRSGIIHKEE